MQSQSIGVLQQFGSAVDGESKTNFPFTKGQQPVNSEAERKFKSG